MTTSTRLKGKSGFALTGKIGAAAAKSVGDDVKKFELTYEKKDDDDLTFAEANAGTGYDATLKVTGIISADAASLHAFLTANVGADVVLDLAPFGNAAASADKPHYVGTARVDLPPPLQNEAGTSEVGAEFEYEFKYSTLVNRVTS